MINFASFRSTIDVDVSNINQNFMKTYDVNDFPIQILRLLIVKLLINLDNDNVPRKFFKIYFFLK